MSSQATFVIESIFMSAFADDSAELGSARASKGVFLNAERYILRAHMLSEKEKKNRLRGRWFPASRCQSKQVRTFFFLIIKLILLHRRS